MYCADAKMETSAEKKTFENWSLLSIVVMNEWAPPFSASGGVIEHEKNGVAVVPPTKTNRKVKMHKGVRKWS